MRRIIGILLALIVCHTTFGQVKPAPLPYFTFNKGLGITAPDSVFSINLRFRIQNRVAFKTTSGTDFEISEVEARVRRLRLRLDGFVYSPKLSYVVQLSFSRGDMDYEALSFPNVIRDAYVQYAFTKNLTVGVGQTKLPGNRQRITSSGDQQLVDRSIVNSTFNIDRDYGIQFSYKRSLYSLRGAISTGDGRNLNSSDNGLAYTGRFELLPFGAFTNGGEYYEGDLAREQKPKLAIGLAYSHNERATRTGGQLGSYLYANRDIKTSIFDFLYKYHGFALSAEYLTRVSLNPVTENADGAQRYVYTGAGQNYQGSYLFKNNYEIVGRYSEVNPNKEIESIEKLKKQYTIGLNKYLKGHRVKLQSDLTLESAQLKGMPAIQHNWQLRFQIEAGI